MVRHVRCGHDHAGVSPSGDERTWLLLPVVIRGPGCSAPAAGTRPARSWSGSWAAWRSARPPASRRARCRSAGSGCRRAPGPWVCIYIYICIYIWHYLSCSSHSKPTLSVMFKPLKDVCSGSPFGGTVKQLSVCGLSVCGLWVALLV